MRIEYIEEKPGVVRLTSKIEGLLTPARCIEEAKKILNSSYRGNLGYADTQDLCDCLLLAQESTESRIHTVIFSMDGEDVIVNKENIEEVTSNIHSNIKVVLGGKTQNGPAIIDALIEQNQERY